MRLILLLGATVVAVIATDAYGAQPAASPGYQAPVAGPYGSSGPAVYDPAPPVFFYDDGSSGSSSSSSSSSESSSSESRSSESNEEEPKKDKCWNNLASNGTCSARFTTLIPGIQCDKPTTKPILLRDRKNRHVVACKVADPEEPLLMVGNGQDILSIGFGYVEVVVTCHGRDVWTAKDWIGDAVVFTNVWCVSKAPTAPGFTGKMTNEAEGPFAELLSLPGQLLDKALDMKKGAEAKP